MSAIHEGGHAHGATASAESHAGCMCKSDYSSWNLQSTKSTGDPFVQTHAELRSEQAQLRQDLLEAKMSLKAAEDAMADSEALLAEAFRHRATIEARYVQGLRIICQSDIQLDERAGFALKVPADTVRAVLNGPLIKLLIGLGRTRNSKIIENTTKKRQKSRKNGRNACLVHP